MLLYEQLKCSNLFSLKRDLFLKGYLACIWYQIKILVYARSTKMVYIIEILEFATPVCQILLIVCLERKDEEQGTDLLRVLNLNYELFNYYSVFWIVLSPFPNTLNDVHLYVFLYVFTHFCPMLDLIHVFGYKVGYRHFYLIHSSVRPHGLESRFETCIQTKNLSFECNF